MRVKYLAQEHNTMTQPGLEPGPLDPLGHCVSHNLSISITILIFVKLKEGDNDYLLVLSRRYSLEPGSFHPVVKTLAFS